MGFSSVRVEEKYVIRLANQQKTDEQMVAVDVLCKRRGIAAEDIVQ